MKERDARIQGCELLPEKPGIYKFINSLNNLIYVGKAKNIKKRVLSYFTKKAHYNRKTSRLVQETAKVEFTIADSEFDAFLLENNLIKENQPRYNILLKDDKSFPFICIVNERFPRIFSTRRMITSQGKYFGPYTSVVAMNNVLDLIRKLYKIRTCKYNLSEKNIKAGKFRLCLEYHLGNCLGPCENLQTEENYNNDIKQAEYILKGHLGVVRNFFRKAMQKHADRLEYEKALLFKEKIALLEKFRSKSIIVNPKLSDIHVCSIVSDEKEAFLNYLRIQNGAINFTKTTRIKKKLDESSGELIKYMLFSVNISDYKPPIKLLCNIRFDMLKDIIVSSVPTRGDKKSLMNLSLKNALQLKHEYMASKTKLKGAARETLIMLKQDLNLKDIPLHIECFDNSNLMGTNAVASMVCFKNGVPSKKNYRHYNIRTVDGPDDFSSMREIVYRRYKRVLEESEKLPDLVIIDGGKGQLSSATSALRELDIYGKIPVVGIAKRLEEIYFPEDAYPLHIQKKSPSLRLIQRIRDEAHRFAIAFHRNKRSKNTFKSKLEEIPGVGKTTADKLLRHFKSLRKIKSAHFDELKSVTGPRLAQAIRNHEWK
ncbi:MAG: excinuclease ABC subunit C [Bacteroidetes bacterium]|nr:excinuclease ABC subunit C [Bacteroidota bacterium]